LKREEVVRLLILTAEQDDDKPWKELGNQKFIGGCDDTDGI
jgi:hypothetical protein